MSNNCMICGCGATDYVALPSGDVVAVCSDDVCKHEAIRPDPSDITRMHQLCDYLDKFGDNSDYLRRLTDTLCCEVRAWIYPCAACYNDY